MFSDTVILQWEILRSIYVFNLKRALYEIYKSLDNVTCLNSGCKKIWKYIEGNLQKGAGKVHFLSSEAIVSHKSFHVSTIYL